MSHTTIDVSIDTGNMIDHVQSVAKSFINRITRKAQTNTKESDNMTTYKHLNLDSLDVSELLQILFVNEFRLAAKLYKHDRLGYVIKINRGTAESPHWVTMEGDITDTGLLMSTTSNMVFKTALEVIAWCQEKPEYFDKAGILATLESLAKLWAESGDYSKFAYYKKDRKTGKTLHIESLLREHGLYVPKKQYESTPGHVPTYATDSTLTLFVGATAEVTIAPNVTVNYEAWKSTDKGYYFRTTDKRVQALAESKGKYIGMRFRASDNAVYEVTSVNYNGLHLICKVHTLPQAKHNPPTQTTPASTRKPSKPSGESTDLDAQVKDLAQGLSDLTNLVKNLAKINGMNIES